MQSHTCSCCPRLWPLVKAVEDLQSLMDGVKRAAGVIWCFYLCVGAYLFPCQQILETPWLKSSELFCVLVTEALDLCGLSLSHGSPGSSLEFIFCLNSFGTVNKSLNRLSKSCLTFTPLAAYLSTPLGRIGLSYFPSCSALGLCSAM